jgi:hypothetical protein
MTIRTVIKEARKIEPLEMHGVVNETTDRIARIAKLFFVISSDPSIQPLVTIVISNGFSCLLSSFNNSL